MKHIEFCCLGRADDEEYDGGCDQDRSETAAGRWDPEGVGGASGQRTPLHSCVQSESQGVRTEHEVARVGPEDRWVQEVI